MSFDNSRITFNPFNSYSSVVMPQGRVQLDADWNEFLAEIARRIQAGTLDTMGRAVYPVNTTPNAFYISGSSTPYLVNIGQGRIYIDGLLAENHGPTPGSWDPALAELSGAPQPAPSGITGTPNIPFNSQPYFPGATAPTASGSYLFYLDVWTREVTWLEDPFTANPAYGPGIVDPAVGIDTSGRLQTVWQVRWMPAGAANLTSPGTPVTCGTPDTGINWPTASAGLLTNGVVPNLTTGNCCLTPGTGYTGLENQFYRVQIHQGGPVGKATFKWSRENASVATGVTNISTKANAGGTQVTVLNVFSLGRDQVLNFNNGDWIELLDDDIELNGMPDPDYPSGSAYIYGNPGILCQIDSVNPTTNDIYLTAKLSSPPVASASLHTRIRRWDQSGIVNSTDTSGNLTPQPSLSLSTGDILVPSSSTVLVLEDGLTVSFSTSAGGSFLAGDYWCFSARTDGSYDPVTDAPPLGTHHHYTKLSVVAFNSSGKATSTPDCRIPWPNASEGDCGCCTATVGDNQNSFGTYTSIQQAIDNLPAGGGTVCILPGQYYESIVIDGLAQVTLEGSGPQTTLHAYSADPGGTADQSGSTVTVTADSGLNAIITITNSEHIKLTGFNVEAPDGMACILIDQITAASQASFAAAVSAEQAAEAGGKTPTPPPNAETYKNLPSYKYIPQYGESQGNGAVFTMPQLAVSSTDVTISDLVLAASTAPAIAAVLASLLKITENRILMKDVASLWPAIYVSGSEISIEKNWIGLQDNGDADSFASVQLLSDLSANFTASTSAPLANSGIQIGGYSTGVFIIDNDLEVGAYNAISLGAILSFNGSNPVAGLNGLFPISPVTSVGTTLVLPAMNASGSISYAADGPLQNIRIERNRISSFGLCAIGPVGYFSSTTTPEVIGIANLAILGNTISGSLQAPILPFPSSMTGHGYGAICLPDLQFALVRDNIITDFGSKPGAQVCGIFILNGEQVDISRNTILETRDWATIGTKPEPIRGLQAGIGIPMVSPPALSQSANASAWAGSSTQGVSTPGKPPLYQPGLPALLIDQNIVRLPLGGALDVYGYGPFSITGNQFASGGTVPASYTALLTVTVVNLGLAMELDTPTSFTGLWGTAGNLTPPTPQVVDNSLANSTSGMVLFANNKCQLETRANGATGFASVAIVTLDHLNFTNNLTWIDGVGTIPLPGGQSTVSAIMDVFLLGLTINVSNNRFQECLNSVLFSGITAAIANVTTGNISTFCLFSEPNTPPWGAYANNISFEAALTQYKNYGSACDELSAVLLGGFGESASYKAAVAAAAQPATPVQGDLKYSFAGKEYMVSSDPLDKVNTGIGQIDATSVDRIQNLSVTHQARLTQYTRIAAKVTAQSGATSAKAIAANAVVTDAQTHIARIAIFKQQITVPAPAVTATGWALYGSVYNSSNAPVSGYSLYFVDASNTYQNAFGIAYTAADGSFHLVYAGPSAGQTALTTTLFVQVCNAAGDPVYTSPTAFTPTTGAATYQVITLPAGEKPLGVLPIVFRDITIPSLNKEIAPKAPASGNETNKG